MIDDLREELRGRPYDLVTGRRRLAASHPAKGLSRMPSGGCVWRHHVAGRGQLGVEIETLVAVRKLLVS
jgi:hypothetical protein